MREATSAGALEMESETLISFFLFVMNVCDIKRGGFFLDIVTRSFSFILPCFLAFLLDF